MRPLTLKEITTAFDKWYVPYVITPGAATRDNGSHWSDKASLTGLMEHHTAGDAADNLELNTLINGRPGLRGPLCNFGVGDDGIVDIVAVGSANHAGKGDPKTLAMVQRETTPMDREIKPTIGGDDPGTVGGNSRFLGWEIYYGIRNDLEMNPKQHRAFILSAVAILDTLDTLDTKNTWTAKALIGHREWTPNKIDPRGVKMYEERRLVDKVRAAGPKAAKRWYDTGSFDPAPTPAPIPTTFKEDGMKLVQLRGTDPVYKTDGFQRQHIGPKQYEILKVHYPKVIAENEVELNAFGPEVQNDAPGGAQ